jgi:hypothetical protein
MTPSPCINVCRMDAATGWCEGCQRTLREIGLWSGMSDADKRAVWQALPARREAWLRLHPELRGGPAQPAAPGLPQE